MSKLQSIGNSMARELSDEELNMVSGMGTMVGVCNGDGTNCDWWDDDGNPM